MTTQRKKVPAEKGSPIEQKELHPQGKQRFLEVLKRAVSPAKVPSND